MLDEGGVLRDLSAHVSDITGATLSDESLDTLRALDPDTLPAVEGDPRLGPCVGAIGKFMCIGLNYKDHAIETGNPFPDHPVLFMKANSAIIGPSDDVSMPRGSTSTDWEVELGVVIGKAAKYVSKENALDHVAGYCVCNDVSERHFQNNLTGTWTKGKSCDTFGPTGPWLVTKDEIADVQNLDMWLDVNGKRMQTGNTNTMIFTVAEIIEHLSGLFTLHPGDVISTGTPPGVGMGMKPNPVYLKKGDVMDVWIEGLGQQRQTVTEDA
jgi:2-keto-4-pentenoate hydratase/2-oxohepta-3-ene-1,7-dioic acid hydratase in catechol pathway